MENDIKPTEESESSLVVSAAGHSRESNATIYYSVLEKLSNKEWKQFARQALKLPDSDIDNIETDNPKDVQETKYKMLLSWETHNDGNADMLLKLLNEYKQTNSSSMKVQKQPGIEISKITPKRLHYNRAIEKVSSQLSSEELAKIHKHFLNTSDIVFKSAYELFTHLEDHRLWEDALGLEEKLTLIKSSLGDLKRTDIISAIDSCSSSIQRSKDFSIKSSSTNALDQGSDVPSTSQSPRTGKQPAVNRPSTLAVKRTATPQWHRISPEQYVSPSALQLEDIIIEEDNLEDSLEDVQRQLELKDKEHILTLVRFFRVAVQLGRLEEAFSSCRELASLIRDRVETSAEELLLYGKSLQDRGSFLLSALCFVIASSFDYDHHTEHDSAAGGIQNCALAMEALKSGLIAKDLAGDSQKFVATLKFVSSALEGLNEQLKEAKRGPLSRLKKFVRRAQQGRKEKSYYKDLI